MRRSRRLPCKEVQATTTVVIDHRVSVCVYFWMVDFVIGRGVDYMFHFFSQVGQRILKFMQDSTYAGRGEKHYGNAGAPAEGGAAVAEQPRNPNMKWYIIHSYSGFERKVKESLESRVQAFGLEDKIGKVLIPTESVTEVRGARIHRRAHVLSRLCAGRNGHGRPRWHVVKSTPRVTGFVGTGQQPTPLSEEEVQHIVFQGRRVEG